MATSDLKAKVQARINALTHPMSAFELQQHAIDTVGLNLDLTNIKSVLNSATAAIATATDDEITALNTASVALGVTNKPDLSEFKGRWCIDAIVSGGFLVPGGVVVSHTESSGVLYKITKLIATAGGVSYVPDVTLNADNVLLIDNQRLYDSDVAESNIIGMCGIYDLANEVVCKEFELSTQNSSPYGIQITYEIGHFE